MASPFIKDRRDAFRFLFYAAVFLLLWAVLTADIMFLYGFWEGSPSLYAFTLYYLVIVGYSIGPVIAFEAKRWRIARRKAIREELRAQVRRRKLWEYKYRQVLLTCCNCGWQRTIGYTGRYKKNRALIHIKPAKDPCNVLSAVILKTPSHIPVEQLTNLYPCFRDISHDVHCGNYTKALRPYRDMLRHKPCPRCKHPGDITIELRLQFSDESIKDLARYRSWRIINHLKPND